MIYDFCFDFCMFCQLKRKMSCENKLSHASTHSDAVSSDWFQMDAVSQVYAP